MIKTELGHDVPLQKLIMFGKVMTDEKKFGELNVKDGDFMVLMVAKVSSAYIIYIVYIVYSVYIVYIQYNIYRQRLPPRQ